MRLKAFLVFISVIAVGVSNINSASALSPTEPTSEKYLLDHGHSQEIVRMINLQKDRTEGKAYVVQKRDNQVKRFFRNLWFEQDLTLPTTDFGYNDIHVVETDKSVIPPAIESIKAKYNQKKDTKEININDVKIRETK